MSRSFPKPVTMLPKVELPFSGATAYLSQAIDHQILFMEFAETIDLPEHSHGCQWGVVLEGQIDLCIGGMMGSYLKGDSYFIPDGISHSGRIHAGYADMTFFADKDRYKEKVEK